MNASEFAKSVLNSGLRFDHFVGPFKVAGRTGPFVEGYVSVSDALTAGAATYLRHGGPVTIGDANDELVYQIER